MLAGLDSASKAALFGRSHHHTLPSTLKGRPHRTSSASSRSSTAASRRQRFSLLHSLITDHLIQRARAMPQAGRVCRYVSHQVSSVPAMSLSAATSIFQAGSASAIVKGVNSDSSTVSLACNTPGNIASWAISDNLEPWILSQNNGNSWLSCASSQPSRTTSGNPSTTLVNSARYERHSSPDSHCPHRQTPDELRQR